MKLCARLLVLASIAAWAVVGAAQPAAKAARIGFLGLGDGVAPANQTRIDGLRDGLRRLGYGEGKNLLLEYRWAHGKYERLPALAQELLAARVDVLVTQGTDATRAAKGATATVPIVMLGVSDPVATGLVADIARPGGNITGVMYFTSELNQKRLELLKQALPQGKKFAALMNPANTSHPVILPQLQKTAASLGVELLPFDAKGPLEFDAAFNAIATARAAGLVIVDDAMFATHIAAIGRHATRRQLPTSGIVEIAGAGGVIGFGVNGTEMFRRGARYVDQVLKGAKPGTTPIERVATFELVIDRSVAEELAIKLPQALLLRADRVIE